MVKEIIHSLSPLYSKIFFETGIESHELGQLSSYMHFRPGFSVDVKTLVEKSDQFQESIDIFEPLTRDEPKGKS